MANKYIYLVPVARYEMTGSEAAGEWDLLISNITMEDDAMFQCQVGATHTQPPIRSRYARLTVLAAPAPPTLSPAPAPGLGIVLRQGEAARLECESRGGKPAASISWRINGEAVTAGVEARVTQLPASKKTVTVSSLSLARVARNMSGAVVECEAATSGGREVRAVLGETRATAAASLVVEHPPEVSLSLDSAAAVAEGDTVKVVCSALASPELVEYQWHLAGREVAEARGASELVLAADRRLSGRRVTCLARNRLGQSSADLVLDIKCEYIAIVTTTSFFGCRHGNAKPDQLSSTPRIILTLVLLSMVCVVRQLKS